MLYLIITNENPKDAAKYLVENASKAMVFRQAKDLGQIICNCNLSNQWNKTDDGKEYINWVNKNKEWVYHYLLELLLLIGSNLKKGTKLGIKTFFKLTEIRKDLFLYCKKYKGFQQISDIEYIGGTFVKEKTIKNAVVRLPRNYKSQHKNGEIVSIDIAIKEYQQYLTYLEKKSNKTRKEREQNGHNN